jgi:hypothetical protein
MVGEFINYYWPPFSKAEGGKPKAEGGVGWGIAKTRAGGGFWGFVAGLIGVGDASYLFELAGWSDLGASLFG